jgi:hypothetical protein
MARDRRPPNQLTREELRARIIRRARRLLRNCDQAIIDGESWAENRPDCPPIDLEDFRVCRKVAIDLLKQFDAYP